MLDPHAPIIPGAGAAGIRIGDRLEDVLRDAGDGFQETRVGNACLCDPWSTSIYRSDWVTLSHRDGRVSQITVHGAYRGRLRGRGGSIGLGSTPGELARAIGPWEELDADVYGITDLPGLAFGVMGWFVTAMHPGLRDAPISEITVFAPEDATSARGNAPGEREGVR